MWIDHGNDKAYIADSQGPIYGGHNVYELQWGNINLKKYKLNIDVWDIILYLYSNKSNN